MNLRLGCVILGSLMLGVEKGGREGRGSVGEEQWVFCFEWNGHCVGGEMML